jgi:hypothetical protein
MDKDPGSAAHHTQSGLRLLRKTYLRVLRRIRDDRI